MPINQIDLFTKTNADITQIAKVSVYIINVNIKISGLSNQYLTVYNVIVQSCVSL